MFHLLVTLNANYLYGLKVMLQSLFDNNRGQTFTVHLIHSGLTQRELVNLEAYLRSRGHYLNVITIPEDFFAAAPTLKHYTKEMYYRLLAASTVRAEWDHDFSFQFVTFQKCKDRHGHCPPPVRETDEDNIVFFYVFHFLF